MHLNSWKSVLVSWANALQVVPTTLNFIGDLSPHFFVNLCSYLKGNDVSSLQEAVTYITDYYKSLVLGNEEDENHVALLATAYLVFTSVHKTNDELCKRLCSISDKEQAQIITSALEAFVNIQPLKMTKELVFITLAQLPEGPESCGNSPYLASSGSCSPRKGTPGTDGDTPCRHGRRSSRFKRVKHQLHMAMSLKCSLQEELESARETISNLESVVHVKNQDISQLKERYQRLLHEREADLSGVSSRSLTPVNTFLHCSRCTSLERQISAYQDDALQDKAEIEGLTESIVSLTKKISKLESEKRTLDDHLRLYEEQIQKNNDEIAALGHHHKDLMANKKELECIIDEYRAARSADCSIEAVISNNLGNEVIDLQLSEMRLTLEEKTQVICERDEVISNLLVKLKGKESEIEQLQNQEVHYKTINGRLEEEKAEYISNIRDLEADIGRLTSSNDLMTFELQGLVEQKKFVEDNLRTTEEEVVELNNVIFNMSTQLEHDKVQHEAALEGYRKIISEQELMISSCQSTLKLEAIKLKDVENCCMDLEKTVAIKEQTISSMQQEAARITESLCQEVDAKARLSDECKTLQSTLAEKSVEISALSEDLEKHVKEMLTLELMYKEQEKVLTEKNEKLSSLENDVVHYESIKREMELEILECRGRIDTLESDIGRLTSSNDLMTCELQGLVEQKKFVEDNLQTTEEKVVELNNVIFNMNTQLEHDKVQHEAALEGYRKVISEQELMISSCQSTLKLEAIKLKEVENCCMDLEKTVAIKEQTISSMQQEAVRITESLCQAVDAKARLSDECKTLQSTLAEKSVEMSALSEDLEKRVKEMHTLELLYKEHEKVLTEKNEKLSSLENDVVHYESIKQEMELEILECRGRIDTLEADIGRLTSSSDLMTCELQGLVEQKKFVEDHLQTTKEKVVELNNVIFNMSTQLEHDKVQHEAALEGYQKIISELELTISSCQSTLKLEAIKLKEVENCCMDLEKTVAIKEQTISSMQQEAAGITESLCQAVDAKARLSDECKTLQSTLAEKSVEISALSEDLEKHVKEMHTLELMYKEQEKVSTEKNEKLSSLENDVVHYESIKQEMELEILECRGRIDTLESDIGRLTSSNDLMTCELQGLVEQKKFVEDHLQTTEEKVVELNNVIFNMSTQLEHDKVQHEAALEGYRKVISEQELMISSCQSTLKLEAIKLKEVENRCMDLEKTVAIKEQTISSMQQEAARIAESLCQEVDAKARLIDECKTLQSTLAEKSVEISSLSEDLEKHVKEMHTLELIYKEQEKVLTEKNEKLSSLENDVVHYESIKREMELEILEGGGRIDTLEADIGRLASSNDLMTCELQGLVEQKKFVEDHLQTTEEKVVELNNVIFNMSAQLEHDKVQHEAALEGYRKIISELELTISSCQSTLKLEAIKLKDVENCCMDLEKTVAIKEQTISSMQQEAVRITESLCQAVDAKARLSDECKTLQSTLAEKSVEMSALSEDLEKHVKEMHTLGLLYEEQEKVLTDKNEKLSSLENDVVSYELIKREMEREMLECRGRIHTLEAEVRKLTHSNEVTDSKLMQILEQKNILEEHVTALEGDLKGKVGREEKLQQDLIALQTALDKEKALVLTNEEDMRCYESSKLEFELEKANTQTVIRSLQDEVERLRNENKFATSRTSSLMCETESLNRRLDNCCMDLDIKNETILMMETTLNSVNSKVSLLEAVIKEKDSVTTGATTDLHNTKAALEKYREESERKLNSRVDEMTVVIQQKDAELAKLHGENESKCERIAIMAEELVHVSQAFNIEKTSLLDHAKHLEEMLESSTSTEKELQNKIASLSKQLELNENKLSRLLMMETTLDSANSKVSLLEAAVKEKDSVITGVTTDLNDTKAALEKYRVESEKKLHSRVDEMTLIIQQKDAELAKLREENESKSERITMMAQEQVHVSQTFNVEKTSLIDHAKNLEEMLESSKSAEEELQNKIASLSKQLELNENKLSRLLMMETTLNSVNSKVSLLEEAIKEKDSAITGATSDLHSTKAALERYREESERKLHSRVDEMTVVIQQKDAELAKLREENESKSERIAMMAEELVHVSQTFNVEKTSLIDHAKNLEEMLESSKSAEKDFQNKISSLSKQLELKENKLSRLDEKLSLTVELHNCEKRELTTKNEFLKTQIDENKLKYDCLVKDLEESNVERLYGKISKLESETQELQDKLDLKTKDIQWYAHELEVLEKSANNTMKVNAQLEEEIQSLTRSKIREVDRLEGEIAMLTKKTKLLEPQASDISAKLRLEYEEKLERLKAKMRKVYTEKMEAMMKYQTGEEKVYADEELKREKQKRLSLESKVRELSDQLLILQEEKRALISNNIFRAPAYHLGGPMSNPAYESPPLHKAQSLDRLTFASHGLDNLGADLMDQTFTSRRTSTSSNRSTHLPKGIGKIFLSTGKVFPAAEEDGEVFDNRCLSDLKQGICTLPSGSDGVDRMSILQQRNSMCPPHLKSSYPGAMLDAKEDEIKAIARGNKENLPEGPRSVTGTPSKLRSLFSGRRKH